VSIRKRLDILRSKLEIASQRNSPSPSLDKLDRVRARRTSSTSTGSGSANRGTPGDSPSIPTTYPPRSPATLPPPETRDPTNLS